MELRPNTSASKATLGYALRVGGGTQLPTACNTALAREIAQLGGATVAAAHLSVEAAVLAGTHYEFQAGIENFLVIALKHVGGPTTTIEAGIFKVHLNIAGTPPLAGAAALLSVKTAVLAGTPYEVQAGI